MGLSEADAAGQAWWVEGGHRDGGHRAVARSLIAAGGTWGALGHLLLVPPIRWLGAGLYRLVARNRGRMPGGTPACRS